MESLIKGEQDLFLIELSGLNGSYLTDNEVSCVLEFFVKGRRNDGVVTVSELFPSEEGDSNRMYAVVDTSSLPEGELVCEATIEYPTPIISDQLTGKAYTSTDCNIITNK